jgi:proteasome lid subunit RPN8/RPN11
MCSTQKEGEMENVEIVQLRGETISVTSEAGIMPIHDARYVTKLCVEEPEGNLKIFIAIKVFEEILEYSRKDITTELGGVLIGEYNKESKVEFIKISDFLPARHTQQNGTHIKFTPETWSEIDIEMKAKRFWNKRIVGWYHTHPGWGVFLSEDDIFIQRNFFNLPWQVALVVDPIKNEQEIFTWEGNEIVKSKEFYLYANKDNEEEIKIMDMIRESGSSNILIAKKIATNNKKDDKRCKSKHDKNTILTYSRKELSTKLWQICITSFIAGGGIMFIMLRVLSKW